ncbi:MAG TPA: hypothetical protein GXX30_10735 [Firmicutes bacterium]|nr:hypothetical protein [Candidatus Fermentithermobacillaceae bacterium]
MLRRFRRLSGISVYLFLATLGLAALSGLLNLMPVQGVGALVDSLTGSPDTQEGLTSIWLDIIGRDRPHLVLLSVIIVYIVSVAVFTAYGYLSTRLGWRVAHNCRIECAKSIHLCSLRELESSFAEAEVILVAMILVVKVRCRVSAGYHNSSHWLTLVRNCSRRRSFV